MSNTEIKLNDVVMYKDKRHVVVNITDRYFTIVLEATTHEVHNGKKYEVRRGKIRIAKDKATLAPVNEETTMHNPTETLSQITVFRMLDQPYLENYFVTVSENNETFTIFP